MNSPGVLTIGEAMVVFFTDGTPIGEASSVFRTGLAGAESNVAANLANLGLQTEWFGRLGNDPFGAQLIGRLEALGVRTDRVIRSDTENTGIYFKDRVDDQSQVYYYRKHSAASLMVPEDLDHLALESRDIVHVSGITLAISQSARATVQALAKLIKGHKAKLSFDVNYRSKLWPREEAAPQILELANQADIVFTGRDEAELLWGTAQPDEIRELIHLPETLVVKDADIGATVYSAGQAIFTPSLAVDVVEPVGAGDAFAAGYLAATLQGLGAKKALLAGHVLAAITLRSYSDLAELPSFEQLQKFIEDHEENWPPNTLPVPKSQGSRKG